MRLNATVLGCAVGLAFTIPRVALGAGLAGAEIESRPPGQRARPQTVYSHRSSAGLRYTWKVPEGYAEGKPTPLTVVLHGTGLDYRWGSANHPVETFRPMDIVVSVDGTSPGRGESRLFLGERDDADAFHDFLVELRTLFSVEHVVLYGHSQGGFFVVYYAGEHPEDVIGVVAHASGAWTRSKTRGDVREVAVAYLHGSADPVVPYRQSLESFEAYNAAKFSSLHFRRIPGYNHWPNAVRADECVTWCRGIRSDAPIVALESAVRLLTPKGKDEYQYEAPVDYAGAASILDRLVGKGAPRIRSSKPVRARARALSNRIEAAADRHLGEIGKGIRKAKRLSLDGEPWLGHLLALRTDFRGVGTVERSLSKIGFPKLLPAHEEAAKKILRAYSRGTPAEKYRAAIREFPRAFLYDGFPSDLFETLEEIHRRAGELGLTEEEVSAFEWIRRWRAARVDGESSYRSIWKSWKLE